jgi:hypothetical protein
MAQTSGGMAINAYRTVRNFFSVCSDISVSPYHSIAGTVGTLPQDK